MIISNALQKKVVDRAGLPYTREVNKLRMANRPNVATETRHIPLLLANLKGPTERQLGRAKHRAIGAPDA